MNFDKWLFHPPTNKPNLIKIPVNKLSFVEEDVKEFNEIYKYCLNSGFENLELSPRGAIRTAIGVLRGPRWTLKATSSSVEIILRDEDGIWRRWLIGHQKKEQQLTGLACWGIYKRICKSFGINIEELAIDNGKEIKEQIPSPLIRVENAIPDRTYRNAHHLDINSAYNAGMMKAFPVLEPAIRWMYNKRRENKQFKQVLNCTQGVMQSKIVGYSFSHISKSGYEFTNNMILELAQKLKDSGRRVLAFNTDGVWYDGEIYHDDLEGKDIGQWKNDHVNVKLRFRSAGCYEFEDDEGYHPVVRGLTALDREKPREEWEWGGIYKSSIISYTFIDGVGLISEEQLCDTV